MFLMRTSVLGCEKFPFVVFDWIHAPYIKVDLERFLKEIRLRTYIIYMSDKKALIVKIVPRSTNGCNCLLESLGLRRAAAKLRGRGKKEKFASRYAKARIKASYKREDLE